MLKRTFDIVASALGLLALSPVFLLVWLYLSVANRGKAFFSQPRPGKHGKLFTVYKFRTMSDARDKHGNLLPDMERTTPVGKWLRRLSIDELPQLWNVLKGEMSLVGPRPLLVEYLPLYNKEQARRHDVLPGITGWAQVNGRNSISWQEKFALDIYYVDHQSFALDLKIIGITLKRIFRKRDVNASETETMEYFNGTN